MSFKLYFAGLACLIRESASEYTVALPDGVTAEVDPCTNTVIHRHEPFLIVPIDDVITSDIPGRIISGCFVASLASAKTLATDATDTGAIDETNLADGYHWKDFDGNFDPDKGKALLTMTLKNGTLASQSVPFVKVPVPEERSVFTFVDVSSAGTGTFTLWVGNDQVVINDDAEVLIANVAPEWILDADYPDDDDHFYLYYKLSKNTPGCETPTGKVTPDLISAHPFLQVDRSLRISCSNTIYP
jgi:hypothetical protein